MNANARFLSFLFAFAAGVAILLPQASEAQPKKGGTLVMAMDTEPPTLASYVSTAQPGRRDRDQGLRWIARLRLRLEAHSEPGQVLDGQRRREDHHLQAAGRREVA